jgi:GNAT superfamily N-acetyltransferase
MSVSLTPVTGRRELKQFIFLPEQLHRDHALWMPPIYMDEWDYFNAKKNRAFGYCDTTMALAWQGGRLVGRIMGIINHRHNDHVQERTARFALLESTEDQEVAHALLTHVEDWARAKGMTKIIGPFGFNDQDPEGFQIEGFEHHPTIVTYYNFPYLVRLLEAEGYGKETDYVVYKIPRASTVPELMAKLAERVEGRGFREVGLTSKRQVKRYLGPVLRLMNESYRGIYGYSPLDDQEMRDLAKKYLMLLDVRFLKVVVKDRGAKDGDAKDGAGKDSDVNNSDGTSSEVVGFMVAMPDLYEGIVKSKGRLFPFGFIHILRAGKRARQLDLLLAGIADKYRGKGVDMLMGREMLKSAIAAGIEYFDSHHELETNSLVRAEMERQGGQIYKRYRIFQKPL